MDLAVKAFYRRYMNDPETDPELRRFAYYYMHAGERMQQRLKITAYNTMKDYERTGHI